MPTSVIENRVVEMEFDNKRFEANVKETMTSLEKLKAALSFKGVKTGFEDIEREAKKFDLSPVSKGVEEVKAKFSAMEVVAITALANITNSAVNAGKKFLHAFTFEQVEAGWARYGEKTSSVQTIMAATGLTIEEVNEQLEKLSTFTDETNFSFNDMVSNIGKFTANAVDLETSVKAMEGISAWAAVSGANIEQAGRAMYNLSQAVAVGSVKLMDWKSIENANMATAEFKQTVIDTALELGELTKASDGTIKTLQGHVVSAKNFNSALSDAWFTSEVLLESLNKYGGFSDRLMETIDETGLSATQLLASIEEYKKGTLDLDVFAEDLETSAEHATELIAELSKDSYDFGRKAFKAAQEAKTFQEAIDATKEAVSSGWMKTYEIIFGNYKEAVKLWTAVANILYDIFADSAYDRNKMLEGWKELGGRGKLLDAIANGFMAVHNALKPVKEAFRTVFPEMTADRLYELTEKFREFTSNLGISEVTAKGIRDAFTGLFTIIKQLGEGFVDLIRKGQPIFKLIGSLGRLVIAFAGYLGRLAQAQNLVAKGFSLLTKVLKAGLTVIGMAVAGIVMLVAKIVELVSYLNQLGVFKVITTPLQILAAGIIYLYESIRKLLSLSIKTVPEFIKGIDNAIQGLIKRLRQFPVIDKALTIISNFFKAVGAGLYTIGQFMMPVLNFFRELGGLIAEGKWGEAFTLVADKLKEIKDTVKELIVNGIFGGFKDKDGNVVDADSKLKNFNETLKAFRENISVGKIVAIGFSITMLTLAASITKLSNTASTTLTAFSSMFTNFNKIMRSLAARTAPVRQFAEAIAIIAASMALLSKMDENKLKSAFLYLVAITAIVGTFSAIIAKISRGKYKEDFRDFSDNLKMVSLLMIGLSISVAALSGALVILQHLTIDKDIWARLGILTLLMVELAAIGTVMAKFAPKLSAGGLILLLYSLGVKKIVEALVELGSIPMDGLQDKVVSLVSLMSGLGLLAMGMGNIRISSVLGVLLLAATFKKITPVFREEIIPAVNELSDSFVEFVEKLTVMLNNLIGANNTTKVLGVTMSAMSVTIITVTAIFASVTAVIAILGKAMKNVGKGIGYAGIGLSIFLLSIGGLLAILKKNDIPMDMVDHIKTLVLQILGLMEVMLLTASLFSGSKFGKNVTLGGGDSPMVQFAKMMKAMSFFFISLMAFISVMTVVASGQNATAFTLAASLVESVLVMFALIITAAGFVKEHGAEALKNLKAIAVAMNLVMLLVVVLSAIPEEDLAHGLIAATWVIGLLTLCFAIINITSHSIKREDIKKSTINAALTVAVLGSIVLVIGGLIALALLMNEAGGPMNVLASAAAISMVLLSVKSIINATLKIKVSKESHPERILLGAAALIAATILPMAAIVAVVNNSKVNLAAVAIAAIGIIGILAVLSHLLEVLNESFSSFTATKGRIQMLLALSLLIAAIEVPFIAIVAVAKDAETVLTAMASTVSLLLALTIMLSALSKVGEMSKKGTMLVAAGSFALISTSLLIIAGAFKMLSDYDWEKNESALGNLLACVVVMGVALGILTAIAAGSGGIGAVAIIAVAAAFLILGYAIKTAGEGIWVGASGMEKLIPILKELKDLGLSSIGKALDYLPGPLKAIGSAGKELKKGSDGLERGLTTIATACASLKDVDINYIFGELAEGTARFAESAPGLKDLNKVLPEFAQNIVRVANALDNVELAAIDAAFGLSKGTEEAIAMGIPYDAGFRLGDNYLEGFKAATGWGSPWKTTEEAGSFAPIGLYNGTMANIGMASTAGGLLGSNFITATCTAMGIYGAGTGAARSTRAEEAATATADSIVEASDSKLEDTKAAGERQGDSLFTGFFNKIQEWTAKAPDLLGGIFNIFGVSTDKAISGLENFASKGSKAGDTITEIINAFKEGGFQGGLALLTEKIDGLTEAVGGAGGLLEKLLGVEGVADEFGLILGEDSDMAKQMSDAIEAATAGLDEYSASAATAKNFTEDLTDTIRNQMDIMSEFNSKTEITGEQMLNNMASQISGVRQWSENLQYLEQRGIDDGLLRYLTELGPAGYEKVAAFVNMTDEQLAMAGKLFTESLTLPEKTSGEVSKSWWSTGSEAAKNYTSGLTNDESKEEAKDAGEDLAAAAVDGAAEKSKELKAVATTSTGVYATNLANKKTMKEVNEAAGDIGELTVKSVEDSVIDGNNNSGESIGDVAKEGVDEYSEKIEFYAKNAAATEAVTQKISDIWKKFWDIMFWGLPGHTGKKAEEHVSAYFATVTNAMSTEYQRMLHAGNRSGIGASWSSFSGLMFNNYAPTFTPTIRPVFDTSSFTTDYTKFASAVSADYSKNLSGSINTRTSFDTAFLDAIEDLGDNSDVVEEVRSLKGAMADMTSQISKMQVVLDSNVLVGEMVTPLDNALGSRAARSRREK